jgi:hypothetical protein
MIQAFLSLMFGRVYRWKWNVINFSQFVIQVHHNRFLVPIFVGFEAIVDESR